MPRHAQCQSAHLHCAHSHNAYCKLLQAAFCGVLLGACALQSTASALHTRFSLETSSCLNFQDRPFVLMLRGGDTSCGNRPPEGNASKRSLNLQLWEASRRGLTGRLATLVAEGAEVNATFQTTDGARSTALHFATVGGHCETVLELAALGADLRAVNDEESSALHLAAARGDLAMTQALVARGADVFVGNMNLQTASMVAEEKGHTEVAAWLRAEEEEQSFLSQSIEMSWKSEQERSSQEPAPMGKFARTLLDSVLHPPSHSTPRSEESSLLFSDEEHYQDSSEEYERRAKRRKEYNKRLQKEVDDSSTSLSTLFEPTRREKKEIWDEQLEEEDVMGGGEEEREPAAARRRAGKADDGDSV